MAILNATSGVTTIGNSNSCKLTITVPEEEGTYVRICCNRPPNGQQYYERAVSGNSVTFPDLPQGYWYIDIKSNIHNYSSEGYRKIVQIKSNYETSLSYFYASIVIHIPKNSVCTASIGTTILYSYSNGTINRSDSNYDKWTIKVEEGGEWTFQLSTGLYEKLTISNGETYLIDKWYLYKNGEQYSDLTGGWKIQKKGSPTITIGDDCITINSTSTSSDLAGNAFPTNAINLIGFKTLCATGVATKAMRSTAAFYIGFNEGKTEPANANIPTTSTSTGFSVSPITNTTLGVYQMATDISKLELNKAYPYFIIYSAQGTFNSMWVEI